MASARPQPPKNQNSISPKTETQKVWRVGEGLVALAMPIPVWEFSSTRQHGFVI